MLIKMRGFSKMDENRQYLSYGDTSSGLIKSLALLANDCGYNGRLGTVRFTVHLLRSFILNVLARNFVPYSGIRVYLQKKRGVKIGKNVAITEEIFFDELFPHLITIEDNAAIAPQALILTHTRPPINHKDVQDSYAAPVIIKEGAWIATRATILPGVVVGEGAIVGACSLVKNDVPPNTFVGGVPAKVLKELR